MANFTNNMTQLQSLLEKVNALSESNSGGASENSLEPLNSGSFTLTSRTPLSGYILNHDSGKVPLVCIIYTYNFTSVTSDLIFIFMFNHSEYPYSVSIAEDASLNSSKNPCDWTETTIIFQDDNSRYLGKNLTYSWMTFG